MYIYITSLQHMHKRNATIAQQQVRIRDDTLQVNLKKEKTKVNDNKRRNPTHPRIIPSY